MCGIIGFTGDEDAKEYIERIKQLKNEKRITNQRLSELTGIPIGTLSKILAGISDSPKLSNIISICDALGCSIDYIVTGREENEKRGCHSQSKEEVFRIFKEKRRRHAEVVEGKDNA